MTPLLRDDTEINDALLNVLAHMPTASLPSVVGEGFYQRLSDQQLMRLAVLLAQKSYDEGGCPIGAVIIDNRSRQILGKGHNTLVQQGDPYNHGETAAIRDAGRIDFSQTTLFTSLSPCDICSALLAMRGFPRVVVGDVSNAAGNEAKLREQGIVVEVLEDPLGIALYAQFRATQPQLELEDWRGLAGCH